MKIIGITGGVGCGKSAVLSYLSKEFDAVIVETDKLAHDMQKPGEICYRKIIDVFGGEILDNDGIINRTKLGNIVFSDKEKMRILNEIVHPEVISRLKFMIIEEKAKTPDLSKQLFVIESAILFESNLDELCDETWYIYTDEDIRRDRLKKSRGYSDSKIDNIMKSQLDEDFFRKKCTKVINNNDDIESTFRQIREEL